MLKDRLIHIASRNFYPQKLFAKSIMASLNRSKPFLLVDAPCGNGETAWHFSKMSNATVYACDIDSTAIANAKKRFSRSNLAFEVKDLVQMANEKTGVDYFCMINSFFLFPDPAAVLQAIKKCLKPGGLLYLVVPNTQGRNFLWFSARNSSANSFVIEPADFENYFEAHSFTVKRVQPIAYAHHYGRRDVKLFSVFSGSYLGFLNHLQSLLKAGTPNYFLIELLNQPGHTR